MKLAYFSFLFLISFWASAQIVVSAGSVVVADKAVVVSNVGINNLSTKVDLTTSSLILKGLVGTRGIRTTSPLSVANLTMDSDTDYTLAGTWIITNQLTLTKGNLVLDRAPGFTGKLTYTGSSDLIGSDASYVEGPLFIKGSGLRTWPIGDLKGYAPVALQDIDPVDASSEIGFDISADPGFTSGGSIKEIFTNRFWQIFVNNPNSSTGGYLGSQISLSLNGVDPSFADSPTVLERQSDGTTNDLGAQVNNSFFTSNTKTNTSGKYYAIAKTDVVTVKVHKLITPDNDETNDVLFIEGIDNFDNEVTILDRWGVPFKKWTNFKNYALPAAAQQADVDFAKLAIGNYIVVVKYKERGVDRSVKQMISVLK